MILSMSVLCSPFVCVMGFKAICINLTLALKGLKCIIHSIPFTIIMLMRCVWA